MGTRRPVVLRLESAPQHRLHSKHVEEVSRDELDRRHPGLALVPDRHHSSSPAYKAFENGVLRQQLPKKRVWQRSHIPSFEIASRNREEPFGFAGRFSKQPPGVCEISHEVVQPVQPSLIPALVRQQRRITERPARRIARLTVGHTGIGVLAYELLPVKGELPVELGFHPIPAEHRTYTQPQHTPESHHCPLCPLEQKLYRR